MRLNNSIYCDLGYWIFSEEMGTEKKMLNFKSHYGNDLFLLKGKLHTFLSLNPH